MRIESENEAEEVCRESHRTRRERQARKSTRAGVFSRFLFFAVRMLSIPLSIRLLSAEMYGLWLAVGSLVNWLALFELGIGSGLVNALSAAYARNDRALMRRHISTALFWAAILTLVGMAVAVALARWEQLPRLLGVANRSTLEHAARLLVVICGCLFAFSVLTNVMGQVWLGLQKGYLSQVAFMGGTIFSLLLLIVLTVRGATLAEFAFAVGVPPIVACFLLAIHFFARREPELRPGRDAVNRASLKVIGGAGVFLSLAQVSELVILCSANLLISSHLGPAQVPRYAVSYSLLMFVQSVCLHFIVPLWPAYSEALEHRDWHYIRQAFRRSTRTTLALMCLAMAGFALLGRWFIGLWAGEGAVPPGAVVAFLCLWFLVWTWNQNVNVLVNALGAVRRRAFGAGVAAVVFLGTAFLMLPQIGLAAMPLAGLAGALAETTCTTPLLWRRLTGIAV